MVAAAVGPVRALRHEVRRRYEVGGEEGGEEGRREEWEEGGKGLVVVFAATLFADVCQCTQVLQPQPQSQPQHKPPAPAASPAQLR